MQITNKPTGLGETIRDLLTRANSLGQVPIVIGNFSLSLLGVPAVLTQDVDVFLSDGEAPAVDLAATCCLAKFVPREEFLFRHPHQGFVQLEYRTATGRVVGADIMFPIGQDALWESLNAGAKEEVSKRWKARYRVPTLADLILLKTLAGRPKDFATIAMLVTDVPARIDQKRIAAVLKKIFSSMRVRLANMSPAY